jgi:hypothetical protein
MPVDTYVDIDEVSTCMLVRKAVVFCVSLQRIF